MWWCIAKAYCDLGRRYLPHQKLLAWLHESHTELISFCLDTGKLEIDLVTAIGQRDIDELYEIEVDSKINCSSRELKLGCF